MGLQINSSAVLAARTGHKTLWMVRRAPPGKASGRQQPLDLEVDLVKLMEIRGKLWLGQL